MTRNHWSFHDWANAIQTGKCPPNEEICNLFRTSIEPETDNGKQAWRAFKEYGSSAKSLIENFNSDNQVQEMVFLF